MRAKDQSKLTSVCADCPERIEYIKAIAGPSTVEELESMDSSEIPVVVRRPKFCECGGIHYAKGMCRKCYHRFMYQKYKLEGMVTKTTINFSKTIGVYELLGLVKKIATHEGRSLNNQVIMFMAQGVVEWLEENGE